MSVSDLARRLNKPSWQLSFVFLAFILGVAVHSWIPQPLPMVELTIAGFLSLTFGILLVGRRQAVIFFSLTALLFGLARYAVSFPTEGALSLASAVGAEARIEGTILNDPANTHGQQQVILGEVRVNDQPKEQSLIAYFASYPDLSYGWQISFRCRLNAPEASDDFDYPRFLLKEGIVATCFSHDEPMVLSRVPKNPVRAVLYNLRQWIQDRLRQALPEPTASISAGLLIGVKTLPAELDDAFRKIGVSHIFAASGSNVGMVLLVCMSALAYLTRRQKALWVFLLAIVVYVMIAGAEAAVVRAGIMAAVILLATHSGRATTPRNLLLLAATLMLLANPRLLRDDVGFQLSMLATTGMAVFSKTFNQKLEFLPKAFGLREAFSTTCSATLFTLPIMLINFHQFSFLSPIANLLILPLVPYAMVFSSIAVVFTAIWLPIGIAIGGLAWSLEQLIIVIAKALAQV